MRSWKGTMREQLLRHNANRGAYRGDYGVVYNQVAVCSGGDSIFDLLHGHRHYRGLCPWCEWAMEHGFSGAWVLGGGSFHFFGKARLAWFVAKE